ncbi:MULTISPECIES: Hsp70 family protein [unclassified Duganella]|uniref:Hsp70 family protein n=1 Tax=unclassified Duganella TaxID=2636909 RepID=UPI0008738468|nr:MULTISPECIES: Hsp70 family protein [unclassified Duganella]OEZ64090.1 chaperone protein DnaK [Duganella sp. HH105]OFA06762.1 chaperone protein DnaK [Duganella sp. HH101]
MAIACGVDFGTSNSTVGWVRPGHPVMLGLEEGKTTLPSVVFFNAEDEEVTFGRAALAEYLAGYEGRLMRSMKSLLGTSLIDGQTEVGGRALPFRALLAQFIGEVKRRAEQSAGRQFTSAVFGRPVHFIDDSKENDQLAEDTLAEVARSVGFKDIAFQFEPIAAAFDYESQISREELVLIADIGGGTSDFSLVRLSPERAKKAERRDDILANGGVHIGGTDFDKYLSLSSVMPLLGYGSRLRNNSEVPSSYFFNLATWHTINQAYTKKMWTQLSDLLRDAAEQEKLGRLQKLIDQRAGHWLAMKVEEGKIALSDAAKVQLSLDRLSPAVTLELDRAQFDDAIGHLVGSVENTVLSMLRDAGVAPADVDTVFFTGGSSGVRMLRERIGALVPSARKVEGDLFGSIGAGLALDAVRKFG